MVFWPHICNFLAYMESLAKKYFWSNVLNRSLLITEGGTYAKMIYVKKIIKCYVFQRWSKFLKLSRNQKHHEKRLRKTLIVMFSDFLILIIFKSPCCSCLLQHANIPSNKNITRQNWRKECCGRFGNFSSEIPYNCHPRRKDISKNPQNCFSKLRCFFTAFWRCVSHVYGHKKDLQ